MTDEVVLAYMVRDWIWRVLPGESDVVDAAVTVALRAFAGGASITEACIEGRRFAGSWCRHPSHRHTGREPSLGLAS